MLEIYVSTDVETDGPVAGKHSILSIGSAAYTAEKEMLSTFSANLETLPNALPDSKTAAWWLTQPEAWSACRQNLEPPRDAMARYVTWLKSLPGKPVFVAYPTTFDFPFVLLVSDRLRREEPIRYSAIDHQNLFDGADAQAVPHMREAVDAGGLARSGPAYSCGARRRHRAGATVLQYAESQSRGRLTESSEST